MWCRNSGDTVPYFGTLSEFMDADAIVYGSYTSWSNVPDADGEVKLSKKLIRDSLNLHAGGGHDIIHSFVQFKRPVGNHMWGYLEVSQIDKPGGDVTKFRLRSPDNPGTDAMLAEKDAEITGKLEINGAALNGLAGIVHPFVE